MVRCEKHYGEIPPGTCFIIVKNPNENGLGPEHNPTAPICAPVSFELALEIKNYGGLKDDEPRVFLHHGTVEMDDAGENEVRIGNCVDEIPLAVLERVCPDVFKEFGFEPSETTSGDNSGGKRRLSDFPTLRGLGFLFPLDIGLGFLEQLFGGRIVIIVDGSPTPDTGAGAADKTTSTTTSDTEHTGDTAATTTSPEDAACDHPTGASHQSGAAVTDDQA